MWEEGSSTCMFDVDENKVQRAVISSCAVHMLMKLR